MASEIRGMYSPPNGAAPEQLPDNWLVDGVETDLSTLSDSELDNLGWVGPVDDVSADFYTETKHWDSETRSWIVTEAGEELRKRRVNYRLFWDLLTKSLAYSKIKETAATSLAVNTEVTEFIALISDAKSEVNNVNANIDMIQQSLNDIFSLVTFTSEELVEIEKAFVDSGMYAVYTLPSV